MPHHHPSPCSYRTRWQGEHDAAVPLRKYKAPSTCDPPQITQVSPSQSHRSAWQLKSLMRSSSTSQNQTTPRNFQLLTSRRSSLNGSALMLFAFAATSKSRIGWYTTVERPMIESLVLSTKLIRPSLKKSTSTSLSGTRLQSMHSKSRNLSPHCLLLSHWDCSG